VEINGTGLIGEIVEPGYEQRSPTISLKFEGVSPKEGVHTTIDGAMKEYGLEAEIGGSEVEPISMDFETTATFAEGGEATITE
jgi:hypothetical protein